MCFRGVRREVADLVHESCFELRCWTRTARLSLIVTGDELDLTEAAARHVAQALREAVVVYDSPATTTNAIRRPPR